MPPDAQKAFSKLQARRQNYGQYEFVTDTDLREVWNEDFLTEFFSYPGEDLSDDEYKRIRDGSIKMLSILVAIGWKDWVRAKVWLAAPTPRLEDSMLPLDRVDFEHIPELSALDIDNFRLRQREYNPIVIRENMMSEDLSGRILPITETSCSIGRGAYGDVTKVQVAKRQFQDANGNRNEVRMTLLLDTIPYLQTRYKKSQVFALKKLKIKNEGEECEEVKNLRLLKLDCRTDTRISIHKAIFVYDGLYHILYDLAQANFREFLEEEEFERYLRPNDCIHPLFEATWELSNALTFLHTGLGVKGVKFICCHMDLKPENILVFIKDGKFSLKIADFGISRFKPDPHAQGDEIRDVHSYQSGSTTGTMPRRYPWEFAAPEMCGKKVGRKIDVWALGCILIIITIRAFRGIEWLKRFEFNKGDESGRYKDDRFYHHRTESVSREYELKPDVNEWLDLLSHGDDSYLGPLEELGLGKKAAKKILSKLHSLICDSLVIDSKARISSAKLADDLYKIKGGIPASPFHQLKIEDTLDTMEGEAPDNLLSMISGPGLRLYELCAKRCHLDERCSGK
jgi:serine/threonine protein kinase